MGMLTALVIIIPICALIAWGAYVIHRDNAMRNGVPAIGTRRRESKRVAQAREEVDLLTLELEKRKKKIHLDSITDEQHKKALER